MSKERTSPPASREPKADVQEEPVTRPTSRDEVKVAWLQVFGDGVAIPGKNEGTNRVKAASTGAGAWEITYYPSLRHHCVLFRPSGSRAPEKRYFHETMCAWDPIS